MSSTRAKTTFEWKDIPWRKLERMNFKLQKRIYRASNRGDVRTVHRLQKLLMKSWSAKCLAVRRTSQDNQGKKTAGIDGVKSLTPWQRLELVQKLTRFSKAQPTRRIWIPKPGTAERRALGIPTLRDRAQQALVKLALEPEWEAKFEPNSFGFRPGRSCHDAIGAIYIAIRYKPKFVLDADIFRCFDRINHQALLAKLKTTPTLRRAIKAWLKAGVFEQGKGLFPTDEGTSQGAVLSPLLANVSLHGLEETARACLPKGRQKGLTVIRYADDFVVIHEDLAVIQAVQEGVSRWLKGMGLELKPSKTQITHTLSAIDGKVGFDFLGFHVRQHSVSKYRSGSYCGRGVRKILGFKTIITPSKQKVKEYVRNLGRKIDRLQAATATTLIEILNPVIRGWSSYYSTVVSRNTFQKLDHYLTHQLIAWAKRRHPNKNMGWKLRKYWLRQPRKLWVFTDHQRRTLLQHTERPIKRHIKVQGGRSPYDGDWSYWATRTGTHPELPKQVAKLLQRQQGKCLWCGLYFRFGDLWEQDHIDSNQKNNRWSNFQLLHRHCHDTKTAKDRQRKKQSSCSFPENPELGMRDKHQTVEEPCECESLMHGFVAEEREATSSS